MALDVQQERNQLHSLIDHLPVRQIVAVRSLLEAMLDPFDHALATAPIDDEPLTEDYRRDIEAAREWFKHNEGIPFEQVVAELGLTPEEIRNHREPEQDADGDGVPGTERA